MTDWDPATIETEATGSDAYVNCFACALIWLWSIPARLFASLRDGRHPQDDDSTDAAGADEGAWNIPHNDGCNAA